VLVVIATYSPGHFDTTAQKNLMDWVLNNKQPAQLVRKDTAALQL
jgi:hypothetical protein